MLEPQGTSAPRCYHCNHLLADINAPCPVCLPDFGSSNHVKSWSDSECKMLLIRVTLGLNPIHDPVEAVRVLYEEGREAFEKMRGPKCDHAAQWKP